MLAHFWYNRCRLVVPLLGQRLFHYWYNPGVFSCTNTDTTFGFRLVHFWYNCCRAAEHRELDQAAAVMAGLVGEQPPGMQVAQGVEVGAPVADVGGCHHLPAVED